MQQLPAVGGVEAFGRPFELLGAQADWSESTLVPPLTCGAVTAGPTESCVDNNLREAKIEFLKFGKTGTSTAFFATPRMSGLGATSRSSSFSKQESTTSSAAASQP